MFAIALALSLSMPVQREDAPVPPPLPRPAPAKPEKPGPKSDDPFVELLDEGIAKTIDEIVAQTRNPNKGDLTVERADVFAGLESLKQSGDERHADKRKGWGFKIVEKPTGPNEFRYVRFAWKKEGGGSLLLGFGNDGGWSGKRYAAGEYGLGTTGVKVAAKAPTEWTVVTRDVFKDFGALGLTSILFSSTGAGTSHFDHVLLGRSIEDLDAATDLALGKGKAKIALSGKARDAAWADLVADDPAKASAAYRAFLPGVGDQVEYIRTHLPQRKVDAALLARARAAVAALKSEDFDARIAAEGELIEIGEPGAPILRAAVEAADDPETHFRARAILDKIGCSPNDVMPGEARAGRIVRLLERARTQESKALLAKLAAGDFGGDHPTEATAALARLGGK